MSREILFRGKDKNTGEWVYGVPVVGKLVGVFMVWLAVKTKGVKGEITIGERVLQAHIIPETLGQFTGLVDKNGNKVFEGDRCEAEYHNRKLAGIIIFNTKTCMFEFWYTSIVGEYGEEATHSMMLCHLDKIEVIGNIHEKGE